MSGFSSSSKGTLKLSRIMLISVHVAASCPEMSSSQSDNREQSQDISSASKSLVRGDEAHSWMIQAPVSNGLWRRFRIAQLAALILPLSSGLGAGSLQARNEKGCRSKASKSL
jgi:hypothetical protein